MSEQRCKNCKHWDNTVKMHDLRTASWVPDPYGVCNRIEHESKIPDYGLDPESVLDEEPAFVEDGSDYHAALRPGPEFGCVLWEAKE